MNFKDYISKSEIIDLSKNLIKIEGHKKTKKRESEVAKYIKNLFEKEEIKNELKEIEYNRPNIYGKIEGENDEIELMFNGHIDTIPGFNMDYDPFKPFIKENKIYGRGSADMKSGIAAVLAAIFAIKRSNVNLDKSLFFAGVVGEEERSKGTEQLVKDNIIANNVIIPEPTELEVSITHKGMEWIEVVFNGKSTHGSKPKEGINSIYAASEFCNIVRKELQEKLEKKRSPLIGNPTINVGVFHGGDDPNIVPNKAKVQIDRRWLPSENLEEVHNEIKDVAQKAVDIIGGDYEVRPLRELTASMINAPHRLNKNDNFVKETISVVEKVTSKEKEAVAFPGWSDAGIISNQTPAKSIILGPGNIDQAHANDEYCDINEILQAAEIYFELIKKRCLN